MTPSPLLRTFRILEERRRRLEAKRAKGAAKSGKRTLAEAAEDAPSTSKAPVDRRKADLKRVVNKLKKSKVEV